MSNSNPALPVGHPFFYVQSNNYWSSTTYAYNTDYAWYVLINYGNVSYGNKTVESYHVWPVRDVLTTTSTTTIPHGGSCAAAPDCGEGYCCCYCSYFYITGTTVANCLTPEECDNASQCEEPGFYCLP